MVTQTQGTDEVELISHKQMGKGISMYWVHYRGEEYGVLDEHGDLTVTDNNCEPLLASAVIIDELVQWYHKKRK